MKKISLNEKDIASCLTGLNAKPSELSAFHGLTVDSSTEKWTGDNAAKDAASKLVKPFGALNLKMISARGAEFIDSYITSAREWISCKVSADGVLEVEDSSEQAFVYKIAETMQVQSDAAPALDTELEVSVESICALTGIIECRRERSLNSLIQRKPERDFQFTVEEVYAAYSRSLQSKDHRWLAVILRGSCDVPMDIGPAPFGVGFEALSNTPLVKKKDAGFVLTAEGEEYCAALSVPLAGMSLKIRFDIDGTVDESHMAGIRGPGMFCLYRFIKAGAIWRVVLKAVTFPELELIIHSCVAERLKKIKPADLQQPSAAKQNFCTQCGAKLVDGSKFCNNCGARIE